MDNPVAANVLGTAGAVCWSIQLIPQIIINYRRHDTTGLQPSMMMLWACAGVPLGVYNITNNFNVALRIQPQILTFLSLATWAQCRYYDKKWPISRCLLVATPIALLMAATQAALIFALRAAHSSHLAWPDTLMAVLSAALLAAGVLRHYWDIYVHRSVRGISFIFVAIDAGGDLFSLISVSFQPELDILGMVIYGTELALWIGVFACGGYFNLLPWIKQHLRAPSETHESRSASEVSADPSLQSPHDISLRNIPSSTSVFRTPSSEFAAARARAGFHDTEDQSVTISRR
ncbi:PQ loop repeat domain-containing protein [Trichoderma novae-zelandiae]